ncbi:MAG: hypothetical protein ACFFDT_38590, partial [Candidatus Hodarchaeota archaeon]
VIAAEILNEKMEGREYLIGWYHSHPNLTLFLSHDDKQTQSQMQGPNPACIAIVVDPYLIKKLETDPSVEFVNCFRLDDPFAHVLTYHTVPLVLPQPSLTSFLIQTLKWVTKNSLGQALSPEACENEEERELSQALSILFRNLIQRSHPDSAFNKLKERITKLESEISELKQILQVKSEDESKSSQGTINLSNFIQKGSEEQIDGQ